MPFELLLIVGFLFGIGLGFFVQRSGLCFAHGFGEIFIGKGKRIIRMFLLIFIISSPGFFLSGLLFKDLGLKTIGQIRGYGLYNIVSGIIFGMGILLNGGCILGTLRNIGEGNLTFLIVFVSFIPGMALIVYFLNPVLKETYHVKNILLPNLLGIPAQYLMFPLILIALLFLILLCPKRKNIK